MERQTSGRVNSSTQIFIASTDGGVALVEFSPTSSPELDAIFNKYRETLFIPSVLSEDHRRLIYRPSKHGQLLNEPGVTVTLPNDEDLKLQPMQLGQRPVKRQTIVKIKEILASTEDDNAWNNLIPFLEGMKTAKEPIEIKHVGQITRKAYERGKYSIPVRCAELAKRTDFRLRYPGLASVIFTGCHNRAAAAGFEGDELLAAAKQAEYIALMLEREEHCGGSLKDNQVDARKELRIVGVLLELAAAKAIHLHASTDLDGQVARYVAKSLALSDGHEFKPTTFERPHYRSDKGPSSEKKPLSEEESQTIYRLTQRRIPCQKHPTLARYEACFQG